MLNRHKAQDKRLSLIDLIGEPIRQNSPMSHGTPWYVVATRLRKQQKITLQQIADVLGCAKSTVGHWLTGHNPAPLKAIKEIAVILGTNEITLLADDPFYITDPAMRDLVSMILDAPAEYKSVAIAAAAGAVSGVVAKAPPPDKKPD